MALTPILKGWTVTVIGDAMFTRPDGTTAITCLATKGKKTMAFSPDVPKRWAKADRYHYLCRVDVGVDASGRRHIISHTKGIF